MTQRPPSWRGGVRGGGGGVDDGGAAAAGNHDARGDSPAGIELLQALAGHAAACGLSFEHRDGDADDGDDDDGDATATAAAAAEVAGGGVDTLLLSQVRGARSASLVVGRSVVLGQSGRRGDRLPVGSHSGYAP